MLFYRKKYIERIQSCLDNKNALILVWARQVWKSSLIQILREKKIVNEELVLSGDEFFLENFSPKEFLELLEFRYDISNKKYLIIDEAQKIKNIGIIIKYLVDKNKQGDISLKLIISGSGSLEVFRGITDSLIGRYNLIQVRPFSFSEFLEFEWMNVEKMPENNAIIQKEIEKNFQIYLRYGWYPEVVKAKTQQEKKWVFKSIYDDYLYKDIGFLLQEDENIYFIKFLQLFATKIWSLIKAEQIIAELGIKKKLYVKFLQIAESSFLFDFIEPFSWNLKNEIKKSRKWYMNDIGFLNYILWPSSFDTNFYGKIIENYAYNEIRFVSPDFLDIKFWQNKNGTEVDFVMLDNFENMILPIEIKSGKKDIIPKSLLSFVWKYEDKIPRAIITRWGEYKKRYEKWVEYLFEDITKVGLKRDIFSIRKK